MKHYRNLTPGRDDMQEETYSLIVKWLDIACDSQANNNLEGLVRALRVLYSLLHKRVNKTKKIKPRIEALSNKLYAEGKHHDGVQMSKLMDEAYNIFLTLTEATDDVLFKARVPIGEISISGGGMR